MISTYATWLILGMTAITFLGFRLGGYLVGGLLPRQGRIAYILNRLPALVLISLVAPNLWTMGWMGLIAGMGVLGITYFTGRALLAMLFGVALIAGARALHLI